MSGASAGRILEEASRNDGLPQEAKDALQGLAGLEWFRGHAVLHLMSLSSTLDANMKLRRRKEIILALELQPHLLQAALRTVQQQTLRRGISGAMALNNVVGCVVRKLHQSLLQSSSLCNLIGIL